MRQETRESLNIMLNKKLRGILLKSRNLLEKIDRDLSLIEELEYKNLIHQTNMSMSKLLIKDQLIQFKLLLELMTF
jgi:hypothetical protein